MYAHAQSCASRQYRIKKWSCCPHPHCLKILMLPSFSTIATTLHRSLMWLIYASAHCTRTAIFPAWLLLPNLISSLCRRTICTRPSISVPCTTFLLCFPRPTQERRCSLLLLAVATRMYGKQGCALGGMSIQGVSSYSLFLPNTNHLHVYTRLESLCRPDKRVCAAAWASCG